MQAKWSKVDHGFLMVGQTKRNTLRSMDKSTRDKQMIGSGLKSIKNFEIKIVIQET